MTPEKNCIRPQEIRRTDKTAGKPRGAALATFAFIASFFFYEVRLGSGTFSLPWLYIQIAVIGGLSFVTAARAPHLLQRFIWVPIVLLSFSLLGWYKFSDPNLSIPGDPSSYLISAVSTMWSVISAALVASLFYREDQFLTLWRKSAVTFTAIAIAGFGLATAGITDILVEYADYGGGYRLTGFMSEASAWAPVLPALLFLSWRERKWMGVAIAILATLLVRSPTVTLALLISSAFLILFRRSSFAFKASASIASLGIFAILYPVLTDSASSGRLIASGNPIGIMAGRLISGIQFIETDGQSGDNIRAEGFQGVTDIVTENDWLWTGLGPGSNVPYFTALNDPGVEAWSILAQSFFDYGIFGSGLVISLLIATAWKIRNTPAALLFIPYIISALINSAQGNELFKFVWLAVFCYGVAISVRPSDRAEQESTVG